MKRIMTIVFTAVLTTISTIGYADSTSSSGSQTTSAATTSKPKETAPAEPAPNPVTGTFDFTNNYMFRGISLTDNIPAVQGGLTFTFPKNGIYISEWGSNVDFLDAQGHTATVEFDTALGIANPIGEHFNYNIYLYRYTYPKTSASYNEFMVNLGFYFLTAQYGYSNDVYATGQNGTYYNLGFKFTLPPKLAFHFDDVTISGGIGHYSLPHSAGLASYDDYNLQISKPLNATYVLSLLITDTNGKSVDNRDLSNGHVVGQLTANF